MITSVLADSPPQIYTKYNCGSSASGSMSFSKSEGTANLAYYFYRGNLVAADYDETTVSSSNLTANATIQAYSHMQNNSNGTQSQYGAVSRTYSYAKATGVLWVGTKISNHTSYYVKTNQTPTYTYTDTVKGTLTY